MSTCIYPHRCNATYCYRWSSVASVFVCLLVTFVITAKMAEPIEMPFGRLTYVDHRNHVLYGVQIRQWEEAVSWGCTAHWNALSVTAALYAAKKLITASQRHDVTLHLFPPWKIRPCNALFRQNSSTTCLSGPSILQTVPSPVTALHRRLRMDALFRADLPAPRVPRVLRGPGDQVSYPGTSQASSLSGLVRWYVDRVLLPAEEDQDTQGQYTSYHLPFIRLLNMTCQNAGHRQDNTQSVNIYHPSRSYHTSDVQ